MQRINRSDFISFHTPLTSETSNLLNEETIALCKEGKQRYSSYFSC
jgi:phosphoglycerate dehydrogenase-like enzyme